MLSYLYSLTYAKIKMGMIKHTDRKIKNWSLILRPILYPQNTKSIDF